MMMSFFQLQSLFPSSSSFSVDRRCVSLSLHLVLKWRMARSAAVPRTRRRPRDQVWPCTPTWPATVVSAESPSCTAPTATTNCHQSPCRETPQLSENCEWSNVSALWNINFTHDQQCVWLCITVALGPSSHHVSGTERTWSWLLLLRWELITSQWIRFSRFQSHVEYVLLGSINYLRRSLHGKQLMAPQINALTHSAMINFSAP